MPTTDAGSSILVGSGEFVLHLVRIAQKVCLQRLRTREERNRNCLFPEFIEFAAKLRRRMPAFEAAMLSQNPFAGAGFRQQLAFVPLFEKIHTRSGSWEYYDDRSKHEPRGLERQATVLGLPCLRPDRTVNE